MKLKPLRDRIIVKPIKRKKVKNIIVPNRAKSNSRRGVVVAKGTGVTKKDGRYTPLSLQEGDNVVYKKPSALKIKFEGTTYYMLRETDILGTIDKEGESHEE